MKSLRLAGFFILFGMMIIMAGSSLYASGISNPTPDRAVEIAKISRDRIEIQGKNLKTSSYALFKEFAQKTVNLQKLIDTRKKLQESGFLDRNDPDGKARLDHINASILMEVGELKKTCDKNLDMLLDSLDRFDDAVAKSLIDSQATRSINSNFELVLEKYLKHEKKRFDEIREKALEVLSQYQSSRNEKEKKRLHAKYNRLKNRLVNIGQRRKNYEARIRVASLNQQMSARVREQISAKGNMISSEFRNVVMNLYNTFGKVTPVAETGGTGMGGVSSTLGFSNMNEIRETLTVVDDAITKLGKVLDERVEEVFGEFDKIRTVDHKGNSVPMESFSVEEEMEFIRNAHNTWTKS